MSAINEKHNFTFEFRPVTKLFEEQVRLHPDKCAAATSKESLTYSQLNEKANRIANSLIEKGVGREVIVGVVLDRCCDFYAVRQGILKAGGAFAVAAPDYPDDRIQFIFEDAGVPFIITTKDIADERKDLFSKLPAAVLLLEELLEHDNASNPDVKICEHDLCYCIYTSGSTGKPKGVMIEHINLANFVNPDPKNGETYGYVSRGSVSLSMAAMTFDVSILEEFIPLTNGLTAVIASDDEIQNPIMLGELIIKNKVDIMTTTPTYLSNMIDLPQLKEAVSQIKVFDVGAEAFPPALYDKICSVNPNAYIMNGYGPTETTISCTMKVIDNGQNITIGEPNGNVKVYIVDKENKILPDGETGELVIAGLGVGRGYVNLPEKTEAVFINLNGEKAYKTGDLSKINAAGEIEFFGRMDNQIKLRGLRIELGEIEEVINSFEGIVTSITVPVDNKYLCCYFMADRQIDSDELSDYAAESLAHYMIPDVFIQLEKMPMTANGKIDKKALPKPVSQPKNLKEPETLMQKKIFEIVSQVVGNDFFGIDTSFYKAGLSSISAMKLCILISDEFGVTVKTSDIHENNTVEKLEKYVMLAPKIRTYEKRDIYPLTGSQKGIFAECNKNPESTVYNIPFLFELDGTLDEHKLADAITQMVKAHAYLLTEVYLNDNGEMVQKPCDEEFIPEIVKTSNKEFEALKNKLVRPFKLEKGRLFRAAIYITEDKKYLFTDFHHIIADGNSYDIIFEDINRAYIGEKLEKEAYTGFDAALDEEQQMKEGKYKKAEKYYDSIFDGIETESLPLPDLYGQEPEKGYLERRLDIAEDKILSCCEKLGVTPNILFTGLFGILMSRYTNSEDSLFSTIYNGRNDSRLENTVCMLVKTLPVYCRFNSNTTIQAYMAELSEQLLSSMANDIFPFSDICAKYGLNSDLVFAYQAELSDDYPIGDTIARGHDLSLDMAKMPMLIQVREYNNEYVLTAEYRSDMYSAAFIDGILEAYEAAMQSVLKAKYVSEISIISEKAANKIASFNDTACEYDRHQTISDSFKHMAETIPDRTAVVYKDKKYTYKELDEISDRLGKYIVSLGIGREDVVSILIPRCEYMAIAPMGVIKAGAAYQPLDSTYPKDRLMYMLEDSSAKLLIADRELLSLVDGYNGPVLFTDEILSLDDTGAELGKPDVHDLFILLYTSGSTGVPKGCMLEYGNITSFCHWYRKYYSIDSDSKIVAYASFGFDACMMDIYGAITNGAELHIIPEEIRLDFIGLQRYFEENGITHSFMTTQVGRQFAMEMDCKSLKYLSVGGEKLVPCEPPKNYKLINGYGPTEATIFTTVFEVDKYYPNIPIGKPLDNFKLYITDKSGHMLPCGACGELMISGWQVSRGYLNKPEKTAEAYARNIYDDTEGYEVLYHSGDVARYLPDGNIQIIGRKDSQVKVRGFRIELSEVEEVIRRYEGIKDATVVAFDDPNGGKYIAAYVVSDNEVNVSQLNDFIKETKPAYMVPAVTMQIDKIPLNQNQKVNKKALPLPERKTEDIIKPQNEAQQKLFDCIAEVLGYTEFGITTDIYDAGLTSISAIKLNILIAKAFDIVIKTSDIKNNPTIAMLEDFVKTAGKETKHDIQENYPLTNTQEGIFVECTANMGSTIYNIPYLLRLDKKVDLERLAAAIDSTIEAHPYLKTRIFMDENGDVLQKRGDNLSYKTQIFNVMNREALVRPYMLFNEQLFRFEIYRTCDGNYLFLDIHHIIADGTSLAIIINDINRAYCGEKLEAESYTSYDLALDNRDALEGDAYRKAENYYKSVFEKKGGSISFYPDKAGQTPTAASYHRGTSEISVQDVKDFCQKHGITENVFFISAFGITLGKYNFKKDAVFTTIYHGRNDSRLENTVGMLVKTLPVYCDFSGSLKDCIADVQEQLINSMNNDIYPFSQISHDFNIKADAMVIYQGDNFAFDTIGGEYAQEEPVQLNMAKAPVSISISIERNKFAFEIEYRADMYNEETIKYLADNLEAAAGGILREYNPTDIRLMFEEETEMIDTPAYSGKTFVDLFRETAAKYPDRPAVRDALGQISYRELDQMSDYIAQKLTENGFGREKAAGILCGRTKEYAAAYVGVMKAGGAYVPLDPEYPQSRIEYMLTDSGAENLLVVNRYKHLVEFYDKNIICIDDVAEESKDFELSVELTAPEPENLAYMIYTSGSTGKPKGVMIEHRNLINLIEYIRSTRNLTTDDIVAEFASFCFDASVIDLFAPLTAGSVLYILPEAIRKDAVTVAKYIKDKNITTATFPTQMGELVAELLDDAPALRFVTLGGEKFKHYRNRTYQMINGYGPTENTVSSTEFRVDRQYDNIPIGKSQMNIRSYIVDNDMNRLPVGASGELCHAGRQIARGYHNLPEKTASVFVENPFAVCEEEKRLYRTGDMVRMKGDGNIEYIGRIDSQIKIRGYRVELGEIEGAVLKHDLVKDSAVTVIEKGGNKYIAAYYTGDVIEDEELKTFLEPLIPDYMMPSFFIHIDKMPVTPGGKVDKKALPLPEAALKNTNYVEPVTAMQTALCEIFEKALGIEKVGIEDNFFDLGGSSLTASKVAVMCLSKNISIVYADIFKCPTVRELAAVVEDYAPAESAQSDNEFANYNYNKIQSVISGNIEDNVDQISKEELGDIMITGATGFLGIHILKAYLDNYDGRVYCLVRKGTYESPEKRMMHMLMYYFDNPYEELFKERIVCVDGDITAKEQVDGFAAYKFQTLINCAACVKHFAAGDVLEKINVHGVENLIDFCKNNGRRLIQISTVSVAGEGSEGNPPMDRVFGENDLYIGQNITNEYIRTKFLAERAVLDAVSGGLDAKIIRVGNLMSRDSDGEFQINFITNGFLRSLRGYKAVGKFPMGSMHEITEFSPIDSTALAVLRLVQTDRRFTVFHACNSHHIYMADLIYAMKNHGFDIVIVRDEDFEEAVKEFAKSSKDSDAVSGLIAYTSHNENEIYTMEYSNRFTAQILYRLDYKWPVTDDRYLESAIEALDRLAFFD